MADFSRFCAERIEELDETGRHDEEIKRANKDIAEITMFRGYKRLQDFLKFKDEVSFKYMQGLDKLLPEYGMQMAVEMAQMEERAELREYMRSKLVEAEE